MATTVPQVPLLVPPPREVPSGVLLHVLNRPRLAGSPMWTLPACTALLLGAIGQPIRGVRIALVVFGASLLFIGLVRVLPSLRGSLRTAFRMREGSALLGRIVACRFAFQKPSQDKPYFDVLRNYTALLGATQIRFVRGCLIGVFVLPMAMMFTLLVLGFVVAAIAQAISPSLRFGTDDFDGFLRFTLAMLGFLVFAWALAFAWRKGGAPRVQTFLENAKPAVLTKDPVYEDDFHRESVKRFRERYAEAARLGLNAPLPEPGSSNIVLACKVEYAAGGGVKAAAGTLPLNSELDLAGAAPLLVHPRFPGEVDLFAGLPKDIQVANGRWIAKRVFAAAFSVGFAAAVAVVAGLALMHEVVSLALFR